MPKRTLVDIYPENFKELQALRREIKRRKQMPVPTMPTLVNDAIKVQMEGLLERYLK